MNQQSVPVEKRDRSTPPPLVVRRLAGDTFDVRKFAENFHVLVDVAGSAKHLRELVLKLAVSGGLSSASDETADSLVAELQRQRLRLGKTGVRVGEPSPPVLADEVPWAIPAGWHWIRLRDLGGFLGGGTPSKSNASFWEGPLPWVSPKDMKRPQIDDAEDHISTAAVEGSAVKLIPAQSILYVVRGMILAHSFPVAINTREVTINQDMKALVLTMPALSEFILRSCQAARTRVLAKVERSSHGTCRLESEAVEMLPIALPPLAEQKRIVARVEQLMALIDDLEAKQTKKRDLSTRFTKASLEALTTTESPEAFDTAWQRVVQNFPTILDNSDKVSPLRARILALAVAGRLSLSGTDERAANEELAAILELRRARLGKDPVPPAGGTRPSVPATWCWTSLDALLVALRNGVSTRPEGSDGVPVLRISAVRPNAVQMSELRFLPGSRSDYAGFFVKPGDLLITRYSGNAEFVGACGVVPPGAPKVVHPDKLIRGEVWPDLVDPNYVALAMSTGASRAYIDLCGQTTAGQIGISGKQLKSAPIPLPPLAEQRRIVAKVDQLMKLCDVLEAELRRAEDCASKLVEAVVQEMVAQ